MTAPKKKTDELDTRSGGGIVPTEAAVIKALSIPVGMVDVTEGDEIMAGILAEIASAGSVAEALASGVTEGLGAYDGQVLVIESFRYQPSDFDHEGWPFVVIKAVDSDGTRRILTTGAKAVVTLLAFAKLKDELPFKARVDVVAFETADGEARRAVKLIAP